MKHLGDAPRCVCGHLATLHEHFHAGRYCGQRDCQCMVYRRPRWFHTALALLGRKER